jgi:hypothetical protein
MMFEKSTSFLLQRSTMGLSIHYSGIINSAGKIPQLVEEVQDVCIALDWDYRLVSDELLNGISFTPPECETLCLTFLHDGQLASRIRLMYDIEPANVISVKTQFAGMDVHKTVIKLLQYLSAKYFSHFELEDEGGYWESGDEVVLRKKFELYDELLNKVQTALCDFKTEPGETKNELVKRLEEFLKKRL